MKIRVKITALLTGIVLLTSGHLYAQAEELPEDFIREPWISEENVWYEGMLRLRFDRFTRADFAKFKSLIFAIKKDEKLSPWEGIYLDDRTELGKTEFRLSFQNGFVQYYVYSCQPELRWMNYGQATDHSDTITITSYKSPAQTISLVKVKWGNLQYLVEEDSLAAFAEKAAGLWVEPNSMDSPMFQKWSSYWVKGTLDESSSGLPKFPEKYAALERLPIEGNIIFVGKPVFKKELELSTANSTQFFSNAYIYPVTINRGTRDGVKRGMIIDVVDSDDTILIKSTRANSSTGIVIRNTDDSGREECFSKDSEHSKCLPIRSRSNVKTQVGNF